MRTRKQRNRKPIACLLLFFVALIALPLGAQTPISLAVEIKYDSVQSLDGKYFAVKENGKWGVVKDRKQVLPCQYDYIDALGDSVITFVENGKAGFADLMGKVLIPASYPTEAPLPTEDRTQLNLFEQGSCVVYQSGELKLIDKTGKALLGDSLSVISRVGEAVVIKQNGLYGMTNSKGEVTVEPQFVSLETLVAGKLYMYAAIDLDQMPVYGLVTDKGEYMTKPQFDDFRIYQSKEGIFVKGFTKAGKQALFSETGKLLIQPLYQIIEPIGVEGFYLVSEDLKKGIISANYVLYVAPKYDQVSVMIHKDTFFVAIEGLKSVILNKYNQVVMETDGVILDVLMAEDGSFNVLVEQDLVYGLYNSKGKWLIEPQYDEVLGVIGQRLCVRKGKEWGAVDFANNVVVDFDYEKAKLSPSGSLAVFFDGGKKSKMLCKDGTVREFPKTKSVLAFADYAEYKVGKKKERLYVDGSKIPADFLALGSEVNGVLTAKTKQGWGHFNSTTFAPLAAQGYDALSNFGKDYAFAAKDGVLLVLDRNYKVVQQITLSKGVNIPLLVSTVYFMYAIDKPYCTVADTKTGKTGVITINQ